MGKAQSGIFGKLRVDLDKEFEYLDNELSMVGFKNVVKRWLLTQKNILKARYMARKKDYPINIEPNFLVKLKAYWSKLETKRKAKQMSNTRSKVKNLLNVGQSGITGTEARLVIQLIDLYLPPIISKTISSVNLLGENDFFPLILIFIYHCKGRKGNVTLG